MTDTDTIEVADRPATEAEEGALLRRRIEESGLSNRQFAVRVLRRDERNIRRWLAGDRIPQLVLDFLCDPAPAPWPLWDDEEDDPPE